MKYSYLWLKELSQTKKSPEKLAELLTMRAFELESSKTERNETQLEFAVLPNRAHDALSHIGLAREICAIEGRILTQKIAIGKLNFGELKVEIKDKNLCPRYIGAVIENIEVKPSPKWLRERLLVSGIKPINNIVDITNYVMLETGQPLHAFDFQKIESEFPISNFQFPNKSQNLNPKTKIIVRRAKQNEEIKLLDDKIYKLSANDLVIADQKKPLALAGVMGGSDSSVTNKTTSIILESANFNAVSIRKTRMSHNLITESSYRFERDIDPNLAEIGMARAVELIQKISGKNVKASAISDAYPKKIKPWKIKLNANYANKLLGENIAAPKMKNILENLGLNVKAAKNILDCEIPTRRIDLKTQEDLIEEIGRIFGYESINEQVPLMPVVAPKRTRQRELEDQSRDLLAGLGFSEVMNYSFYGVEDIEKSNLKIEDHIELENPMNPDQQYLRSALLPNLLKNVNLNLKNFPRVEIFEIGKRFKKEKGSLEETTYLVGIFADNLAKDNSFSKLKGKLEAMLSGLGCDNIRYQARNTEQKYWHGTRSAEIFAAEKKIGTIGEVSPVVLGKYRINQRVAVFGINIETLLDIANEKKFYHPISKYPSVRRDISMFVPGKVAYSQIERVIEKSGGELVKNIELFDTFRDSLAIRIEIGSAKKTLTAEEIETVMRKIIAKLEKDLKVKVRK